MRELRRLAWAAAFAAFAAAPALGQTTTGQTVGSTGTNLGTTTTTTPTATGNTGGTGGGGGGGGTGRPTTQGPNNEIQLTPLQQTPVLTGVSAYASTTSTTGGRTAGAAATGVPQASNFLRNVYANPYYQGMYSAQVNQAPGGFGAALYPITATTGTTGGRGGQFGQGGLGAAGTSGSVNVQDVGGIIAALPRQIAYPSQIKFQAPAMAPTQLQTELSGMLSQTAAGVQVVLNGGNNVVLRGAVKDADEARVIEGMVRMTPGVRQITNELTYPRP